jgi:hypothetical protein
MWQLFTYYFTYKLLLQMKFTVLMKLSKQLKPHYKHFQNLMAFRLVFSLFAVK